MIIEKGKKHPITLSDYPNENWTESEDYFIVDDNSILGKKILQNAPYYNEVRDENDNLIDIISIEKPPEPKKPLSELEKLKIQLDATNEAIDFLLMGGM